MSNNSHLRTVRMPKSIALAKTVSLSKDEKIISDALRKISGGKIKVTKTMKVKKRKKNK